MPAPFGTFILVFGESGSRKRVEVSDFAHGTIRVNRRMAQREQIGTLRSYSVGREDVGMQKKSFGRSKRLTARGGKTGDCFSFC